MQSICGLVEVDWHLMGFLDLEVMGRMRQLNSYYYTLVDQYMSGEKHRDRLYEDRHWVDAARYGCLHILDWTFPDYLTETQGTELILLCCLYRQLSLGRWITQRRPDLLANLYRTAIVHNFDQEIYFDYLNQWELGFLQSVLVEYLSHSRSSFRRIYDYITLTRVDVAYALFEHCYLANQSCPSQYIYRTLVERGEAVFQYYVLLQQFHLAEWAYRLSQYLFQPLSLVQEFSALPPSSDPSFFSWKARLLA